MGTVFAVLTVVLATRHVAAEPKSPRIFTYRHSGRNYRLTDVSGNVIQAILA